MKVMVTAPGFAASLEADRFAVLPGNELAILSVAGTDKEIRQVFVALAGGKYAAATLGSVVASKGADGYTIQCHRLAPDLYHLMAMTKRAGFLPEVNDAWLWSVLKGDRYTTPLLRRWMPWIKGELRHRGLLNDGAVAVGCWPGILSALDADVDDVVSHGLKTKQLRIL